MPLLRADRLQKLVKIVENLPNDALYFWRWKMEKNEFEKFGHKLEPRAALEFNIHTTVANPGVWFALLSQSVDREQFALEIKGDQVMPAFGGAVGHDALAAFFGLTPEEEALIFKGESYFAPQSGGERMEFVAPHKDTVLQHIARVINGRKGRTVVGGDRTETGSGSKTL